MFNKVILAGRLVRDPEPRQASTGEVMSLFTLAVDRGYKDEGADFFDCVAFRKTANFVNDYLKKGRLVLVEGNLQINKWTDREGVKKEKPQIIAQRVEALESKKEVERQENKNDEVENQEITEEDADSYFKDLLDGDSDEPPIE